MSWGVRCVVLAGAALALAACGKPAGGGADQAAAPTEPASAPAPAPPELTAAQKKTMLAELPAAYRDADLDNGQAQFAVCRSCHSLDQGGSNMTGPNLYGIFGRKAGAKTDFIYSDDMKKAGWTWDADHLEKWIQSPRTVLPGTKMTFIGVPDAKNRADLIAYLKTATSPAPPPA
ncbi:MAG: c-type cytochrome [Caulobacterales bacterium]